MSVVQKLKSLEHDGIKFEQEVEDVMRNGNYRDCVCAIGVSCENEEMVRYGGVSPELTPDEVLGKVAREVYKWTNGERDIADLIGAAKGAQCRLCKHATFGCVCMSEGRRKADLRAGMLPEFCEMFGRGPLFGGTLCGFWEFGIGEE